MLKDKTAVLIRPMTRDDLEESHAFFRALPEEERAYLRRDVTALDVVQQRLREMDEGRVKRLVAVVDGSIVADGALEIAPYGWERHVGELRLIVAPHYQGKGLGMLMAQALYDLASGAGVEELIVKMMPCQKAAVNIFRKLGFRQEAVLHDYVRDRHGAKQDLIVMRGGLEELWRQFEHYVYTLDVHRLETE
jgi:L-amino acid N-acyltransferase YncA